MEDLRGQGRQEAQGILSSVQAGGQGSPQGGSPGGLNGGLGDSAIAAVAHLYSLLLPQRVEWPSESAALRMYEEATVMPGPSGSSPVYCQEPSCSGFLLIEQTVPHELRRTDAEVLAVPWERCVWKIVCDGCNKQYGRFSSPETVQRGFDDLGLEAKGQVLSMPQPPRWTPV